MANKVYADHPFQLLPTPTHQLRDDEKVFTSGPFSYSY